MKYQQLGDSDLFVSQICLGSMTYGKQNTREEAHQFLDYAVGKGVNFIDTAEMYPVPGNAETQGTAEEYIGDWLAKQQRDRVIIASKVIGPHPRFAWVRGGNNRIDRANVEQAVNASLKRLRADYIDLYQIHWPDRYVPLFGEPDYDPSKKRDAIPIAEQLEVFGDLVKAGKIRYIGLSNETPWGVCQFCHCAQQLGLPKVVSIQNAYNLLNRVFEIHLAEACHQHKVGLLAYSPLAFGFLTGKYLEGIPPNSRLGLFQGFGSRYDKPNTTSAVKSYIEIARKHGISPVDLAFAFVRSRWFVTSTITCATKMKQLQQNINSVNIEIDEEILAESNTVHSLYRNPAP